MSTQQNYKYGDKIIFPNGMKVEYCSAFNGVAPNTEAEFIRAVTAEIAQVRITKVPDNLEKCSVPYTVKAKINVPFKAFERNPA